MEDIKGPLQWSYCQQKNSLYCCVMHHRVVGLESKSFCGNLRLRHHDGQTKNWSRNCVVGELLEITKNCMERNLVTVDCMNALKDHSNAPVFRHLCSLWFFEKCGIRYYIQSVNQCSSQTEIPLRYHLADLHQTPHWNQLFHDGTEVPQITWREN